MIRNQLNLRMPTSVSRQIRIKTKLRSDLPTHRNEFKTNSDISDSPSASPDRSLSQSPYKIKQILPRSFELIPPTPIKQTFISKNNFKPKINIKKNNKIPFPPDKNKNHKVESAPSQIFPKNLNSSLDLKLENQIKILGSNSTRIVSKNKIFSSMRTLNDLKYSLSPNKTQKSKIKFYNHSRLPGLSYTSKSTR